jgi:hypothetical protein
VHSEPSHPILSSDTADFSYPAGMAADTEYGVRRCACVVGARANKNQQEWAGCFLADGSHSTGRPTDRPARRSNHVQHTDPRDARESLTGGPRSPVIFFAPSSAVCPSPSISYMSPLAGARALRSARLVAWRVDSEAHGSVHGWRVQHASKKTLSAAPSGCSTSTERSRTIAASDH